MRKKVDRRKIVADAFDKRSGITRFIALWIATMLIAVLAVAFAFITSTRTLSASSDHIVADAASLDRAHLFERAILAEGREDLLWRATGEIAHVRRKGIYIRDADAMIVALQLGISSNEERRLIYQMTRQYASFRSAVLATAFATGIPDDTHKLGSEKNLTGSAALTRDASVRTAADSLLQLIQFDRALNERQMQEAMALSNSTRRSIKLLLVFTLVAASLMLLAGAGLLWLRVFVPTLQLSVAAGEFGAGDLRARARVWRNDEMGYLARTFNTMADAVATRERDRLDFVATVAHDLKNPLVIIGGAAHVLRSKKHNLTAEEQEVWLDRIENNSRRLEAMIADLGDSVQIQTGRLVLQKAGVDLIAVTRAVVGDFTQIKSERTIHLQCDSNECRVRGDRRRLERVLANLISNALKYSAETRPVWIELGVLQSEAFWRVRDEGAGIAANELPQLFRPFSRIDRTREMATGTGLGLVSVKKIVEAHCGRIEIASKVDVGTTVSVYLPLDPAP